MNEDIKALINTIESLNFNTLRYLICGNPEAVENFKNLINENKELLSEYYYDFEFYSDEKLCEEYADQVYILPLEMKPLMLKFADGKTTTSEFTGDDSNETEIG